MRQNNFRYLHNVVANLLFDLYIEISKYCKLILKLMAINVM